MLIDRIILEPKKTALASVIWMHGLGADAHDFEDIVPDLELSDHVKFIFPNAPIMPITAFNGYKMRGWYDILTQGL